MSEVIQRMSIFNLHANVLGDYRDFVRSFFSVADGRHGDLSHRGGTAQAALNHLRPPRVLGNLSH